MEYSVCTRAFIKVGRHKTRWNVEFTTSDGELCRVFRINYAETNVLGKLEERDKKTSDTKTIGRRLKKITRQIVYDVVGVARNVPTVSCRQSLVYESARVSRRVFTE